MGLLCGVDALVLAMHDPLVWLAAVALVAAMVFRHYRGRNRRRQNDDAGNNQQEVVHHVWIHRDDDWPAVFHPSPNTGDHIAPLFATVHFLYHKNAYA